MAASDKYFQFPLLILRKNWADSQSMVSTMIDVAVCEMALTAHKHIDEETIEMMSLRYAETHDVEEIDQPFLAALEMLQVKPGGPMKEAIDHMIEIHQKYPCKGVRCRLRTDIARDMPSWPIAKARTLIALYAGIGDAKFKWLSYSRIQHLAAGYWIPSEVPDSAFKLTTKAARHWADKLWDEGFVTSVTAGGNQRFYSNKHPSDKALAAHVLNAKKNRKPPAKKKRVTI